MEKKSFTTDAAALEFCRAYLLPDEIILHLSDGLTAHDIAAAIQRADENELQQIRMTGEIDIEKDRDFTFNRTATTIRELLTADVKTQLKNELNDSTRAEYISALRDIAQKGRFSHSFESEIKALEKEIREAAKMSKQKKSQEKVVNDGTDKLRFDCIENPYPYLNSYTYFINDDGVFLGNICICTQPVIIYAKYTNVEDGTEALSIAYHDGEWKTVTERRETLFSTTKVIHLSAYGLSVHSANAAQFIKFLDTFESENRLALIPKLSISRLGWFDGDRFAPYEPALAFVGSDNRDLYEAVTTSGDADIWLSHVRELRKNLSLRLTMAASFASPLIKKAHALPFIYHIWGSTGSGKTVALMVGMSIWGDPSFGRLLRTLNATVNYIVNTATFYHSIPVAFDELQITGSQYNNIDSLVMVLTEGLDRGRMKYSEAQQTLPWNCSFLFSGESPVIKADAGGGVFNRVIEVEARTPVVKNGNMTVNIVRENYGHAGRVFIDHIKGADIPSMFRAQQAEIIQQTNTTGKLAASMALMLIADRLAGECLFSDEQPLTISDIKPYLKTEKDVDIAERAYSFICGTIAANVSKFERGSTDTNTMTSFERWGRIEDGVCTFNKTKLDAILRDGGFNFDSVKKRWAEKNYLLKNSQGRYVKQTSVGGVYAAFADVVVDIDEYERTTGNQGDIPF